MFFKEIEIRNFRNYEYCKENFYEKTNIITGDNAQGKTNLVEALYLMSLGKSFKANKDNEMIMFGKTSASITTVVVKDDREIKTEIIIDEEGKKVKINGMNKKKSDLRENIYIVSFSPEDLRIVKDEPEKRRRFINRELCLLKPIYYNNLYRYTKVLTQRNNLLKTANIQRMMLEVWDEELATYGAKLIEERKEFVKKINVISREIHSELTAGSEELTVEYESDIMLRDSFQEQKEEFIKKLNKNFNRDVLREMTTAGPQKDDLKISINGVDIRHFGSQGQQRTAALSLKLAEIKILEEETGEIPILILDDVLSELDLKRQRFLINSLKRVQLFLTATEISEDLKSRISDFEIFVVKEGQMAKYTEA